MKNKELDYILYYTWFISIILLFLLPKYNKILLLCFILIASLALWTGLYIIKYKICINYNEK